MTENRRSYKRFETDMVFWMKTLDTDDSFNPFFVENISAGGILVNTRIPLAVGNNMLLSFELPQHTDLIEATAEVRYTKEIRKNHFQSGLKFTSVDGVPSSVLLDYLEEIFQ
ncbi:PilZ domain-containing protein [Acanthopleuribacter pedis]|uniref:PilZ domain-containing protein n=1 Tax=Acanthopleuribacter pedis TaxID=442870 RepID=A0A8J7QH02_9BACT|nr:PilZ domain-containing protein [Acanthopleuribacter pedis]